MPTERSILGIKKFGRLQQMKFFENILNRTEFNFKYFNLYYVCTKTEVPGLTSKPGKRIRFRYSINRNSWHFFIHCFHNKEIEVFS
jgi:hypothetical protein